MKKSGKWLVVLLAAIALAACVAVVFLGTFHREEPGNKTTVTTGSASGNTERYAVTFYSDDGTVLKIDSVTENTAATPPVDPAMTYGAIFQAWDTDFSRVTQELQVHPVCQSVKGKPNVLAVQSKYTKQDGTVVVPIQLCGDVCVAGLDITVRYDQTQLTLKAVTEDSAVIWNDATPGSIRLNYVSTQNTVADVDICNLQFHVNAQEGEFPIAIEINGIYAFADGSETDALYIPEATILDGKVYVVN